MDNTFNWRPESLLLKKLLIVANQQDRSPEAIVTEAVKLYIETQLRSTKILSLDRRDFSLFRDRHCQSFEILP
jgi:hypothetical protein